MSKETIMITSDNGNVRLGGMAPSLATADAGKVRLGGMSPSLDDGLARRAALKYGALATAGAFLAGCNLLNGTPTVSATIAQAVADLQAIGTAIPTLESVLSGLSITVPANVNAAIQTIIMDAGKVATAVGANQTSYVSAILAALPVLATFVTPLGLPAAVMALIDAAVSLAPSIAAAFGITGAAPNAVLRYTPDQARKILADAAR